MTRRTISIDPVKFAKALADDTRQKIMEVCCCRVCSVGEIVEAVNVSQPTVSHHLAILRDAGLVNVQHRGKQTFYTLNQDCVVACCGQIMQVFAPDTGAAEAVKEAVKA